MSKLKVYTTPQTSRGILLQIAKEYALSYASYSAEDIQDVATFNTESAYWLYEGATNWQPIIDKFAEYQQAVSTEILEI